MNPEAQQQTEMSVEEAVASLMSELPKPVQDFILSPERSRIALSLSQKYRLHADQAGEFEHAYMFMLLGVSSPEEFVDKLTAAGISAETIRGLVTDVNEQVFIPLRKAEQGAAPATPPPAPRPVATSAPVQTLPGSNEPVPAPAPAVMQPPAPYMYAPQQMPPPMMYPPNPYGMPYGAPVYMWPQPPQPQWAPAQPQYAAQPQQAPYVPAPAAPPAPAPVQQPPVARPVHHSPPAHEVLSFGYQPASAPASQTAAQPSTPIKKDYAADPYREPFA